MNKAILMTEGKPMKLIFTFALPLMLGNIFQQLYTVVDTAIVGRGVEIAALSYSFAVSTFVGQNYGAGKRNRIRKGMKEATVLALVTATIIAGIMIVFGRQITMIFISADDPAVMAAAGETAYYRSMRKG